MPNQAGQHGLPKTSIDKHVLPIVFLSLTLRSTEAEKMEITIPIETQQLNW